MLRILPAGTALASLVAFGVQAQDTPPAPETTPPAVMENQLPSATSEEPAAPIVPESAADADTTPPADVAPESAADANAAPAADAAPEADVVEAPAPAGALPEGWMQVDVATLSPDTLIGVDIRSYDGTTIAAVEDVLMSAEGKIDDVVARFGGFLGFGETRVLLAPEEVSAATDADGNVAVLTGVTADELKSRPEYTPAETEPAG